jgi:predicted amidohydrolase
MTERGVDLFLVDSAWPAVGLDSWILFNRAQANANLAYLLSCNCAGSQGDHRYGGHSLFVDPLGRGFPGHRRAGPAGVAVRL